MRRGHGRPAHRIVARRDPVPGAQKTRIVVVLHRREDPDPGRRNIDPIRSVTGERGQRIDLVGRGYGDTGTVGGRVGLGGGPSVARGAHQHRALVPGVVDRLLERLAGLRPSHAEVDDLRTGIGRPANAGGERRVGPRSRKIEHFRREQLHRPIGTGDPRRVVGAGTDGPGHVGPMAVLIVIGFGRHEVLRDDRAAGHQILMSGRIGDDVVGVSDVNPGIHDGDLDRLAARRQIPCLVRSHLGPGPLHRALSIAGGIAGRIIVWIVGVQEIPHIIVGLHKSDLRVGAEDGDGALDCARRNSHHVGTQTIQILRQPAAHHLQDQA